MIVASRSSFPRASKAEAFKFETLQSFLQLIECLKHVLANHDDDDDGHDSDRDRVDDDDDDDAYQHFAEYPRQICWNDPLLIMTPLRLRFLHP